MSYPFAEARLMPVAVLTAAVQEPHGREKFETDPIGAAMETTMAWIGVAKRKKVGLQLSAALARPDSYIPAEAMLDPVGAHLAVRTQRNGQGEDLSDRNVRSIIEACGQEVQIFDLGCFENLLHPDDEIRAQVHAHMLRCARAAKALAPVGCAGVTGFIGANSTKDLDQNVGLFEKYVIPLLKEFQQIGVKLFIEQCPMPGWNTTDNFINNIAYCAGMWIKLRRIAEKHGVREVLEITYDESHDILMGNTHHGSFAAMASAGMSGMISRFHGKNQYRNLAKVALWTGRGQMIDLGCRIDGQPHPDPAKQGGAWGVMPCQHGMVGIGNYNPLAMFLGQEADWLDHQLAARSILGLDPRQSVFVLEHEWPPARVQNLELVEEMIGISASYFRGVDAAADALYRASQWCADRKLPLPGSPNPAYYIPGIVEEAKKISA